MSDIFELIKADGTRIEIIQQLPAALAPYKMQQFDAIAAVCPEVNMLFQKFDGNGFTIWRSHYFTNETVTITGRADIAVIELCIALKHHFVSSWEGVGQPSLRACQLNFCYAPHVNNKATLYAGQQYETIDFHLDITMLKPFIDVYDDLKYFYDKVVNKEPVQLSVECMLTQKMKSALADIFEFNCRLAMYGKMLHARVDSFLGLVFEALCRVTPPRKAVITDTLKEKAEKARIILDQHVFDPIKISKLAKETLSNKNSIQEGFKDTFGSTIKSYSQQMRLAKAKEMLLQPDQSATSTAGEVGFVTLSGFVKFFPEAYRAFTGKFPAKQRAGTCENKKMNHTPETHTRIDAILVS